MPEILLVVVVIVMGMIGAVAILPYSFALGRDRLAMIDLPRWKLVLLSLLNNAVLLTAAVVLGLLAAGAVGLGAPIIEAGLRGEAVLPLLGQIAPLAMVAGIASGTLIMLLEAAVFARHLPSALQDTTAATPLWKRFLAGFYGGMDEEILLRLFVLSGVAWLLSRIWQTPAGLPTIAVFWAANLLAAVLFGLGHLPATAQLTRLTPMLIVRALALNGIVGVVTGYLYWQHGLETAMIAHFSADMIILIIAPALAHYARQRRGEIVINPRKETVS